MSNVLKACRISLSYSQPFLAKYPDENINERYDVEKNRGKNKQKDSIVIPALQLEKERIIGEAKLEAEKIIKGAQAQAEQIRQEAYDSGYKTGYEKGKDTGFTEGKQQSKAEYEELLSQVLKQKADMEKQRIEMLQNAEEEIVTLALSVAKRIVHSELDLRPEKILAMVRYAIDECNADGKKVLKVSPKDYDEIIKNKNALGLSVDHEEELIIQKDDRLSRGDCIVESDFGIVDAKIDTQLQIIKESFADAGVGRSYET